MNCPCHIAVKPAIQECVHLEKHTGLDKNLI